jgi:adenylate kinase family enzyme
MYHNSARRIVIFGPPASGKRRLGEFLSRRLGLEYVSRQDLVDGICLTQTAFGNELKMAMTNRMQTWDMIERLVLTRLCEKDCLDKVSFLSTERFFIFSR